MNTNWIRQAACRGIDPNLFVPERYDHGAIRDAKKSAKPAPSKTNAETTDSNYTDTSTSTASSAASPKLNDCASSERRICHGAGNPQCGTSDFNPKT